MFTITARSYFLRRFHHCGTASFINDYLIQLDVYDNHTWICDWVFVTYTIGTRTIQWRRWPLVSIQLNQDFFKTPSHYYCFQCKISYQGKIALCSKLLSDNYRILDRSNYKDPTMKVDCLQLWQDLVTRHNDSDFKW